MSSIDDPDSNMVGGQTESVGEVVMARFAVDSGADLSLSSLYVCGCSGVNESGTGLGSTGMLDCSWCSNAAVDSLADLRKSSMLIDSK